MRGGKYKLINNSIAQINKRIILLIILETRLNSVFGTEHDLRQYGRQPVVWTTFRSVAFVLIEFRSARNTVVPGGSCFLRKHDSNDRIRSDHDDVSERVSGRGRHRRYKGWKAGETKERRKCRYKGRARNVDGGPQGPSNKIEDREREREKMVIEGRLGVKLRKGGLLRTPSVVVSGSCARKDRRCRIMKALHEGRAVQVIHPLPLAAWKWAFSRFSRIERERERGKREIRTTRTSGSSPPFTVPLCAPRLRAYRDPWKSKLSRKLSCLSGHLPREIMRVPGSMPLVCLRLSRGFDPSK